MGSSDEFVEALLVAPAGAVLLARLEARHRGDVRMWDVSNDVDPGAVNAAIAGLSEQSVGDLLSLAVGAAESNAGRWSPRAPDDVAAALRDAPARRELARSVTARLGDVLVASFNRSCQEWWWTPWRLPADSKHAAVAPLGAERRTMTGWVTATWEGLWTVASPPPELADQLVDTWDVPPGPTSRWHLAVDREARVFEVAGPADWERLVRSFPATGQMRAHWELPGRNQMGNVAALEALPGQRAMRTRVRRFLVPDWNAVAADWDGVHLTWGGFLTTEGLVIDLGSNDVTMLRGWGSERTLWLNPVLDNPTPLDRPALTGAMSGDIGVDVRFDETRRAQDLEWLTYRLGL